MCIRTFYTRNQTIRKGYETLIHQYRNNGYNIILDVNSGAVHTADDLFYDVVEKLNSKEEEPTAEVLKAPETEEQLIAALKDKYTEEDIKDGLSDAIELTEQGRLFSKDIFEPLIEHVKERKTVVKAMCLHIAHDCNLACKYCFAEEVNFKVSSCT